MGNEICNLCKVKNADKENSHIIPKFMSKRLFEGVKPRFTVLITKEGKRKKLQDTPKESNILCKDCEKRIEIVETYFSRVLIDLNSLQNAKRKYTIDFFENQEIIVCNDLHPTLYKIFIFSLVWRCSISSLLEFETFQLEDYVEEELRVFLNKNLLKRHDELLASLDNITEIPQYHTCLIKPKNNTRGLFTSYNFGQNAYAIYTVDYAIFFYTNDEILVQKHLSFSNINNGLVRVVIGDDKEWSELNNQVLQNMLNYKSLS
ncbi:hypothetical protein HNQ02_000106 [Flavobacterium sp. 7E]|uniref:hypothetical protein n=1 Tax=Flavobacterium sp. 7E TaxID=2735898 RepID=UPI0015709151|nr:hypothetical protein [Flavobacterium sp. 7E]NRS87206.1 hypothetical protein [Flavobacterium sp. 7E]